MASSGVNEQFDQLRKFLSSDFNQHLNETCQLELQRLKKENQDLEKEQNLMVKQLRLLTGVNTYLKLMEKPRETRLLRKRNNMEDNKDVTKEIFGALCESVESEFGFHGFMKKKVSKPEKNNNVVKSLEMDNPPLLTRSRKKAEESSLVEYGPKHLDYAEKDRE